jgi:hypothetical protein
MTVLNFQATPQQVTALLNELKASGTQISQESASEFLMEGHHIKANVTYSDPTLTVTVLSKPFYVSEDMISDGINKALAACPAGTGN